MIRHPVNFAGDDEEEPLLTDSSSSEVHVTLHHRLPTNARIAMICVYLVQILGVFAVSVIQTYLYFTCEDLLHYSQSAAIAISLVFQSVMYVFSIVGGIVADVKFGCYQVTFFSCCLLLLGQTVSYTLYACNDAFEEYQYVIRTFHMIGILFIAVGQGFWNVTIIPLGMRHMYSETTCDELLQKRRQMFLRWFCFSWSIGQFLSIVYLGIPIDHLSKPVQLLVTSMPLWATGMMTFILIIGKRFYIADNIPLGQRKLQRFIQAVIHRYRGLDMDENQVCLLRFFILMMVAFSSLSAYLAIYFQADGSYLHQLRILTNSSDGITIHPVLERNMSLYHPLLVMVTILVLALYGRWAYTCLHWHRVCIGIFFASCSAACAYGVQTYIARDQLISYRWLIPQYALIGISEAFYFVGGFEMSYAFSIKGLETVSLGLFSGVGALFGALLYSVFVASGEYHSIFISLFSTLWLLAIVTLALFMYLAMRCVEAREKLEDDDPDPVETEESDDRERSITSWLEDSGEFNSNSGDRPLRIWENF